MTIYLAGPVKDNPNYKRDFGDAQRTLLGLGIHVLNPASLPAGMDDNQYMPICISMVEQADAVLLLEGWEHSLGAIAEALYAARQGKTLFVGDDSTIIRWDPKKRWFVEVEDGKEHDSEKEVQA